MFDFVALSNRLVFEKVETSAVLLSSVALIYVISYLNRFLQEFWQKASLGFKNYI